MSAESETPDSSSADMTQAGEYAGLAQPDQDDSDLLGDDPSDKEQRDSHHTELHMYSMEPKPGEPGREEYEQWLAALPPEERAALDETRTSLEDEAAVTTRRFAEVREALVDSAAELLAGKLPPDLAAKIEGRYALGFNQSDAAGTLTEAQAYLDEEGGGVPLEGYNPEQRFRFIDETSARADSASAEQLVLGGYYGNPDIGRFVYVFPTPDTDPAASPVTEAQLAENMPSDFYINGDIANPKYCAGFIDETGHFNPNMAFMERAEFSAGVERTPENPYANYSVEQLQAIELNLLDSVARGLESPEDLNRAYQNLVNLKAELRGRSPEEPAATGAVFGPADIETIAGIMAANKIAKPLEVSEAAGKLRIEADALPEGSEQRQLAQGKADLLAEVRNQLIREKVPGFDSWQLATLRRYIEEQDIEDAKPHETEPNPAPYQEMSDEVLHRVKESLMDSVARAIEDMDHPENLARASQNLMGAVRETTAREGSMADMLLTEADIEAIVKDLMEQDRVDVVAVAEAYQGVRHQMERLSNLGRHGEMQPLIERAHLLSQIQNRLLRLRARGWDDYRVAPLREALGVR